MFFWQEANFQLTELEPCYGVCSVLLFILFQKEKNALSYGKCPPLHSCGFIFLLYTDHCVCLKYINKHICVHIYILIFIKLLQKIATIGLTVWTAWHSFRPIVLNNQGHLIFFLYILPWDKMDALHSTSTISTKHQNTHATSTQRQQLLKPCTKFSNQGRLKKNEIRWQVENHQVINMYKY